MWSGSIGGYLLRLVLVREARVGNLFGKFIGRWRWGFRERVESFQLAIGMGAHIVNSGQRNVEKFPETSFQ